MPLHPLQINKFHIPETGLNIADQIGNDIMDLPITSNEVDYGPIQLKLSATLLDNLDTLLVRGHAKVNAHCICDRCTSEFEREMESDEICHYIENCPDIIDLTEYIREDILLSFPQHYLCSEHCEGLCSGCVRIYIKRVVHAQNPKKATLLTY